MKTILLAVFIFFSANVIAEWLPLKGHYEDGTLSWYDNNSIKKSGDVVWVWERQRYLKPLNSIGGKSAEVYFKINCLEYYYQKMQFRVFKNENWINQIFSQYDPSKIAISSNSRIVKLADIVCKNRSLATEVKPR